MDKAQEQGFENIRRPDRFGNGNTMTVAIVDKENWLGNEEQPVDKQSVVKTLKEYDAFLKKVCKEG